MSCDSTNNCNEIYDLMNEQEKSWNSGDIDDFMSKYWNNDSLIFIGKSGINYGWKKTISNYKKSYKNKNEMGRLEFKNILCKPINRTTHIILNIKAFTIELAWKNILFPNLLTLK